MTATPTSRPEHSSPDLDLTPATDDGHVYVVLDDDPTGTQSVRDLPVLTGWDDADLEWGLTAGRPALYIETNSRSLTPRRAEERIREVSRGVLRTAQRLGIPVTLVMRGDSTLRGHYPLETDVISQSLQEIDGREPDAIVLVPAFPAAGRITVDGIHYASRDGERVPVGETEFARDVTFGYRSSRMDEWVEEKTDGRVAADQVALIPGDQLGGMTGEHAERLFTGYSGGTVVVPDVPDEQALGIIARAAEGARRAGRRIVYRVGPSFPRACIGQKPSEPLRPQELPVPEGAAPGGLVVIGSHVALTTRQVQRLRAQHPELPVVELDVTRVGQNPDLPAQLAQQVADALQHGDVLLQTSRTLVRLDDPQASLEFSASVSMALSATVRRVIDLTTPRFVIAKGGITSSDVAQFGLDIRRAWVEGSMLPGLVSLWRAVDGPAQGTPYVVFAGNVGSDGSLVEVVDRFHQEESHHE